MILKTCTGGPGCGILRGNANSDAESVEPEAIGASLAASEEIEFVGQSQEEIYGWVKTVLLQQEYFRQGKKRQGFGDRWGSVTGYAIPKPRGEPEDNLNSGTPGTDEKSPSPQR